MFRLEKSERHENLHSYLKDEKAALKSEDKLDDKALAKYHNLLTACLYYDDSKGLYDQIYTQLSKVTEHYTSLNNKTREAVDRLLADQVQLRNFPSTPILLEVSNTISRHRDHFCSGIHCAVNKELLKRINSRLSKEKEFDLLSIYKYYGYSNFVLQAFSEAYAGMSDEQRAWHKEKMLRNLRHHKAEDLVGILSFAHTMPISLKNAEGMPGKVGKHCYTRRHPITLHDEQIEYDVKFVENFPMVVAEAIQQRLHSPQRGVSLTINL